MLPFPAGWNVLRVLLGGQSTQLLYVSRSQVNAQIPYGLLGSNVLELEGPNGTMTKQVSISETAPAVFLVIHHDRRLPAILHAPGGLVTTESPAAGGEALSIYLIRPWGGVARASGGFCGTFGHLVQPTPRHG